jgi:acetoin utilization protein AcuA
MVENQNNEIVKATPLGRIRIRSFCTPDEIGRYAFEDEFTVYVHYKSLYTRREGLEKYAAKPDANVVLALAHNNHIVGFGVLAYPDPGERWLDLGPGIMIEINAVEVCRSWRYAGIAARIVEMMLAHPRIEDKIVYLVGYSWTWDLDGTEKTAQQYRRILIKLFEPHGFQEFRTNEPNVCLKPENLFMCRIGKNIPEKILDRFKWLRFGLTPWTWT